MARLGLEPRLRFYSRSYKLDDRAVYGSDWETCTLHFTLLIFRIAHLWLSRLGGQIKGSSVGIYGCGDQNRTDDLRVMSPTRYHFSTPRYNVDKAGIEPATYGMYLMLLPLSYLSVYRDLEDLAHLSLTPMIYMGEVTSPWSCDPICGTMESVISDINSQNIWWWQSRTYGITTCIATHPDGYNSFFISIMYIQDIQPDTYYSNLLCQL